MLAKYEPKRESILSAPAQERILSGAPEWRTWKCYSTEDGALGGGVWEATPGKWTLAIDRWEFMKILSGKCILTDSQGVEHTLEAGDCWVMEPGFSGTWEVVETVRKEYFARYN